jgi:choline dehydrogenase
MMLSGLGPKEHLHEHGIKVINELPGVGINLNDHPDFVMKYKCKKPVSLWPKTKLIPRTLAGIRWFINKTGMCATNHFDVIGCVRSSPEVSYPDIQLCVSPVAVDDKTWKPIQEHAFQIHVGLMRAFSRGKVRLKTNDPHDAPKIIVNYLKDERDREILLKGINIVRKLVKTNSFSEICGKELFPGKKFTTPDQLNKQINNHVYSQWHLSGTAAMGSETNNLAVVDFEGKVFGIENLRVVDASIMPVVTNGNTNCPTIMMAEKLSDAILQNNN